jgi:hypothetical protein
MRTGEFFDFPQYLSFGFACDAPEDDAAEREEEHDLAVR